MESILEFYYHPILPTIHEVIEEGDLSTRKHLLMLARHLGLPQNEGSMYTITRDTIALILEKMALRPDYTDDYYYLSQPFRGRIAHDLHDAFSDPIFAGAVLMSCFVYTPNDQEIEEIKLASYMKEITVMGKTNTPPPVDFSPFFGMHDRPLHTDIPTNPKMARHVNSVIDSWVHKIAQGGRIFTPKLSVKLLPSATRRDMESFVDVMIQDPEVATQASLEWLEFSKNIRVTGVSELKQRWYMNGVVPRSYFVSGPNEYFASRYTKDIWNMLVDELVVTNRFKRVNPERIHVEGIKHALFYDLTSFTSNMDLQRPFLEALAVYVAGAPVSLMSTRDGPGLYDLGELIREYNETNTFPQYFCPALPTMLPGTHGVAGFLGVYGNIATCTFLHGAILLQLVSSTDECGCAGDDAVVVVEEDDEVWCCVRLMGILATEKTFTSEHPDVIYLKRRTWVNFRWEKLSSGSIFFFPSMVPFLNRHALSRFRESKLNTGEKKKLAASTLMSTFLSASRLQVQYRDAAYFILQKYYSALHFPVFGWVPQYCKNLAEVPMFKRTFIPSLSTLGSKSFIEDTLRDCYTGWARLPDRVQVYDQDLLLKKKCVFVARPSEALSFMVKMGLVALKGKKSRVYMGDLALEMVIKEYDRRERKEGRYSTYEVINDIPEGLRGDGISLRGEYSLEFGNQGLIGDFDAVDENEFDDPTWIPGHVGIEFPYEPEEGEMDEDW